MRNRFENMYHDFISDMACNEITVLAQYSRLLYSLVLAGHQAYGLYQYMAQRYVRAKQQNETIGKTSPSGTWLARKEGCAYKSGSFTRAGYLETRASDWGRILDVEMRIHDFF